MPTKIARIIDLVKNSDFEVLVILGPTAVGKTKIAIELAEKLDAEIISADSRMVYKKMDIGTSKPSLEERRGVIHHLIDVVDPDQLFNVSDFKEIATEKIIEIKKQNKLPLIVGGTMLYLDALIDNYVLGKSEPNLKIRAELESLSKEELFNKLLELDPVYAKQVDRNNPRRLIRPLEVIMDSGLKFSEITKREKRQFKFLKVGIFEERDKLYQKINARVLEQLDLGLLEETQNLAKEYSYDLVSMSGLGYKQLGYFLRGEISLKEAVLMLERATRHFAKRQLTWWRKDEEIIWI